ncbi:MAG: SpaH/EbpB family LPXTG-anchored major pilin [Clostridia bacterium]|nr:SpaH/EbpB family LPXTG-anchored major pilin [Clostridia bacterium]
MKRLSKILAAVVAVALVLALAVPALANGTITILNPGEHTYTAYKIFDVTGTGDNLTYTVAEPWKTAIKDALEAGEIEGLEIVENDVVELSNFSAADFAAWAKDNIPSGAASYILAENADGEITTGSIPDGYYLVVPDTGDRASLCTVIGNDVSVQNKSDMPFDKVVIDNGEEAKESDVQVGDTLEFEIHGVVPALDADQESYFYLVTDRLTDGLTLDEDSVEVTIGGTQVELMVVTDPNAILTGNQIRYITDNSGRLCGFDLSLDMMDEDLTAGDAIVISYTATVNNNAVSVVSENFATLDYGDENNQSHKESMTKHYTSNIVIDKYETGSPESKVEGAGFILYRMNGSDKEYYSVDASTGVVSWVADEDDATEVTTDKEGAAVFAGLADGTYYLHESTVPNGYVGLTEDIEVEIDGSDSTTVGLTDSQVFIALNEIVRVENTPGSLLPSTGGMGTYLFYIVGGVLVVAALAAIVVSSRKRSTNN